MTTAAPSLFSKTHKGQLVASLVCLVFILSASCDRNASYGDHRRLTETASAVNSNAPEPPNLQEHLSNFEPPPDTFVLGASSFPEPFDKAKRDSGDVQLVVHEKPVMGQHRPDQDAVFLFASEYELSTYLLFVESLRSTGFQGDIVVAVHENSLEKPPIRKYLEYHSKRGLVVYAPKQVCYNMEGEVVASAKGGSRTCNVNGLYGRRNDDNSVEALEDPRSARTLANIRYEIYWIMAQPYKPDSWLLLIDARDAVFQSDPFEHVPRTTDPTGKSGVLYFFGESMDATRIGKSKHNDKWVRTAYGDFIANSVKEKPTICSGASMGERVAVESYLRAMVAEADETRVVLVGSDQGFHNRLFYSRKLEGADNIHAIVVFDQGSGIINNMGAMRTKELEEWGNGNLVKKTGEDYVVLNWDGTPSPVVHQFDRHKVLSAYFFKTKYKKYREVWEEAVKANK